jgi:hypothetical protein
MIKLFLVGIWVCAVTLASGYAAVWWQTPPPVVAAGQEKPFSSVEAIKTRMISVPMIAEGAVHGYVMVQFTFMADARVVKALSVKPEVVFLDEAFKSIYAVENIDFRNIRKQDLPGLSKRIVESINKRFGSRILEDALIMELNYISKDRARASKS